ncbi:MAG: S41 family peptidase [Ignavibacteriales bacterium]|nr:S41 family peptidase [Ignavibacteriales bacterium]
MKSKISLWTVVALMAVSLFAGMEIRQLVSGDSVIDQADKFREVLSLTQKYYVKEVDAKKLTESAVEGLLDKLDPHSVYIAPKAFEQVAEEYRGKFDGIGVTFTIRNDSILVVDTFGGGPSAKVGIQTNDRIVRIGDSSSVGWNNDQVKAHLRGPKGTKVKVGVHRPGTKELLDFEIIRDEIAITSVDIAMMVNDDIGYISVNKFSEQTAAEMEQALKRLKTQGMKRLILDLRSNPGGLLEQAFEMADLFLDGGTKETPHKIVYTKARISEFDEVYFAKTGQSYENLPLIVLLGNYSASASEIVAGAIQDWDRGLIVGETSFGKGLVQRQWRLKDGSALRLTIARYYTPSGRLIQREYEGKDKEEYQKEAFARKEKEGENLEHKAESDSSHPVFHTHAGRVVYGGGGITPDYVVKNAQLTALTQSILRRGLYEQYVTAHLDGKGLSIRSEYSKNWKKFRDSFTISDEMVTGFRSYLEAHELKVDEKEFQKDLTFTKTRLKATFARNFWGNEGWYPLMLQVDAQYQKALSLFPEAEKIAKLN